MTQKIKNLQTAREILRLRLRDLVNGPASRQRNMRRAQDIEKALLLAGTIRPEHVCVIKYDEAREIVSGQA